MNVSAQNLESLTAQIHAAVHGRPSFEASQVKIVGLEQIKEVAGADWEHFAKKVRTYSQCFIERRMEKNDILVPAGDGFVVLYDNPDHAEQKSAALQKALNMFYLGESGMEGIRAEVEARSVTIESALSAVPLKDAGSSRSKAADPHTGTGAGAEWSAPSVTLDLAILPVWSPPQEAVTGHWITPVQGHGFAPYYGYDRGWGAPVRQDPPSFLSVDQAILRRALECAEQGWAQRRPSLTCYTVHASTMARRDRRQQFLQQLHDTPMELRPHLFGRIAEIEPGTPRATIAEWVHQLRPVSPRVQIELHSSEHLTPGWREAGIVGIACVATPMASAARYTKLIKSWSSVLKREGLMLRIDNLNSPDLLEYAVEQGVDRMTSGLLWPAVAEPQGMRAYSRVKFVAALRSRHEQLAASA